jgi:ACT domain-containing protein
LFLLVTFCNHNFLESAVIYSFAPNAVKHNRSTLFSVSTTFVDQFGTISPEYFCGYGANTTTEESLATINNGIFTCFVILPVEGKAKIDISMKTKGIKKKLTNTEEFNVVSMSQLTLINRCKFL